MPTRVVTAHIPDDLAARVDEMAERLERSRGWIVKQALAAWVDLEDERQVSYAEGQKLARAFGGAFLETSAETVAIRAPARNAWRKLAMRPSIPRVAVSASSIGRIPAATFSSALATCSAEGIPEKMLPTDCR